ncbi:hypothetical protein B4N84_20240 [Flavobacterium sp. IR1]|nr:hypothetical protein B4N84_20240 [Flavobacterium sp. IR1]
MVLAPAFGLKRAGLSQISEGIAVGKVPTFCNPPKRENYFTASGSGFKVGPTQLYAAPRAASVQKIQLCRAHG